ncbi:MAG: hypothetical protein QOF78_2023 [Phycisphaerales bacterium]|jgi:hypothetical protein|nr:hypothetical protein [Phycisphaerales bacterium]
MRKIGLIVFVVVMTLLPRDAQAWNEAGHMTVAAVAWRQLDDAQRKQIGELLRQHPHYEKILLANKPDGVDANEWAVLRSAVWPDLVRPSRPNAEGEIYKGPEITRYHRGDWHYIDKPWVVPQDVKKVDPATRPAATRPMRENILTALEANSKILADRSAKPADRAVAFCWIMHLAGDIHQPLHAISMYSAQFPDGDRGGNANVVRGNDNVVRLHAYWDSILGNSDAYEAIEFLANGILGDPQLARPKLHEIAERPAFAQWADESHRWAIAFAYLNGRLRTASADAFYDKQITDADIPPTPTSYYTNARDLSRRRIALAGFRLAEQINTLMPVVTGH